MLKVVIAGLGAISETHLTAIRNSPNAQLAAVCDLCPEKAQKAPEAVFYTDIETMLQCEKPDCLHICLPHHLHVPVAKLAAKYGVHVFMEKPPALNLAQLNEILTLEQEAGIHIAVCLQNRYNASNQMLKKLLTEQSYGRLKGCKAIVTWNRTQNYYTKDPWRGKWREAGGGVMLSQAIHTLDLMTWLCGAAQTAQGMTGNLLLKEIEVEDTAVAHISFPNQVSGVFYGSITHCTDSSIELEIVCENAILTAKDDTLYCMQNGAQTILAKDVVYTNGKRYYGAGHQSAIDHFYSAILQNTKDYISLADAVPCMQLIEMIADSAAQHGKGAQ